MHPTRVPVRAAQGERRFFAALSSLRTGLRFHHFGETRSPLRWGVSKALKPNDLRCVESHCPPLDGGGFSLLVRSNSNQELSLQRFT
jgi:hypothetical protein